MINLTAQMRIQGENPSPFRLGVSRLGENLLGEKIDNTEVINKRNILSLDSEIRDRADIDKPSFGLISSGGRLSFRDDNSRFLGYAKNGILKGNEPITVFLNNTISKTREQVGKRFATDWDYDNDSHSVSVSFSDDLQKMQDIPVDFIEIYDMENPREVRMDEIYSILHKKTPSQYNMLAFEELDEETKLVLRSTSIAIPYIEKASLWRQWEKVCYNCLLQISIRKDGRTVCKYIGKKWEDLQEWL
jgi:hypothetical protein